MTSKSSQDIERSSSPLLLKGRDAKSLIFFCTESQKRSVSLISLFALTDFQLMAVSPTLKCYLKTTASGSWCCARPQTLLCDSWKPGYRPEHGCAAALFPQTMRRVEKALFSTVWFSFMIVCRSVLWKFKQSCNLYQM